MINTNQHPIESLMKTAMENIREMIEVNTVVGDAIETAEGTIIMPITKAAFGFAAGGAEYGTIKKESSSDQQEENEQSRYPFGGGSGAGVNVQPVAFMVIEKGKVQMMHVNYHFGTMSKVMEEAPNLISKLGSLLDSKLENRKNLEKDDKKDVRKNDQEQISKVLEFNESK